MNSRRWGLHIGFWLLYGLYDGYLNAPNSGSSYAHLQFGEQMQLAYWAESVVLLYKIPATYLVLYYLVPWYFRTRNLPGLLAALGAVTVLATLINKWCWFHLIYPHIYQVSNPEPVDSLARQLFRWLWNSIDILLLLSVAAAIRFFRLSLNAANREAALIREKTESELNFLKAQVHPHFLFNTLNNLYHLARKKSDESPDAILKLSELMRCILYECSADRIPVSKEVQVIRDYIELEKLRYGNRLRVNFQADIAPSDPSVAPLLMLPLVENAFKHGASETRGDLQINIHLSATNTVLELKVDNPKDPSAPHNSDGIGLKNVKRQLEILYPEHKLEIHDLGDTFSVFLRLKL